jgi:copper chaperone CopZ
MNLLKMMVRTAVALMLISLLWPFTGQSAFTSFAETSSNATPENGSKALRRLDFRIKGKSCPACLHSIQNKIKTIKGVEDAVVDLAYPFGVSVVYRGDDVDANYIIMMLKVKEFNLKTVDISDKQIEKMPLSITPPFKSVRDLSGTLPKQN